MTKRRSPDASSSSQASVRKVARVDDNNNNDIKDDANAKTMVAVGQGTPKQFKNPWTIASGKKQTPKYPSGKEVSGRSKEAEASIDSSSRQASPNTLKIIEESADIFAFPKSTLLIHACNAQGHWSAGIAKAFKDRYPAAYKIYHSHCTKPANAASRHLSGTALLIPPQVHSRDKAEAEAGHFVGCLFTSRGKGRDKDSPATILANTGPAMRDLLSQVEAWNAGDDERKVGDLVMCRINSGLFNVPWEKTKAVLEGIEMTGDVVVTVVEKG